MTQDQGTAERLAGMNDVQLAAFFEFWATSLIEGTTTTLETIQDGVPAEVRETRGFAELADVTADGGLDTAAAADVARSIFGPLVGDPQLGPTIEAALDQYDDSRQMVGVILALGLVASVLLIISTVELDGKVGGFKIHKTKPDVETAKAIMTAVFGVVSGWSSG